MVPYIATTHEMTVTVRPVYLDSQSDLMSRRFVFGYFIRIENLSGEEVQLLRRHWYIRDGNGRLPAPSTSKGRRRIVRPSGGLSRSAPFVRLPAHHLIRSICRTSAKAGVSIR